MSAFVLIAIATSARPDTGVPAEPSQGERRAASDDAAVRTIFVVAARQKPRIIRSLVAAGFDVRPNLLEAHGFLRVTVGSNQGWRSCGTRNNVKFSLKREGKPLLEFVEKGWTGTCEPSVFDAMSAWLMQEIARPEPGDHGSNEGEEQTP
jgi:hypothetical protein